MPPAEGLLGVDPPRWAGQAGVQPALCIPVLQVQCKGGAQAGGLEQFAHLRQ